MNINLKRRYPNSRTEDITDAFARGFETGYNAGYNSGYHGACKQLQDECKKLQAMLDAMLAATFESEASNED